MNMLLNLHHTDHVLQIRLQLGRLCWLRPRQQQLRQGRGRHGIDLAPDAGRFFKYLLLIFLIQKVATGLRFIAGVCKMMNIANTEF
ncbi:hypothetical protein L1987_37056 [Smallanthus sonchifolius]|uniref:Uncharacterized protein n=1 Tax=Smallanthus sonchifolius TaxID=185202 RepID=A0ACB9HEW0_9ASTR|nr:hypothetical protein L1987_37056 [Smallanthus sonchifolius]